MGKLITSRTRWTAPHRSAEMNIKSFSLRVEMHGQLFKKAIEAGDTKAAADNAYWLDWYARQAAWAGNLILNQGRIVKQVIAEIEQEMAARKQEAS